MNLLRDKRLWLLCGISLFSLIVGRVVLPPDWVATCVRLSGYWFTLVLVLCVGWALVRLPRAENWWAPWRSAWVAGSVLLSLAAWHAHERQGFKILSDESVLLGTSQQLHMEREVGYAVRTTDVRGPFEILQSVMDKRPVLFPFLVSLVHDWTGYRPTNPFWFNGVLGAVFLFLAAGLAYRVTRSHAAGAAAVLLLGGIPLLAQQTNGGGFELLNLTFLVTWIWLAMRFASEPTDRTQDAFVLVAVALGSTRYESLLYMAPTAALLLGVWLRRGAVIVTPLSWVAPLLLLPTFWLNQAFETNTAFWEMETLGASRPFGLDYVPGNLGHALAHFLSTDGYQPNSPAFALLGLLSLPVLLIWCVRRLQALRDTSGDDLGLLTGVAGLVGGTVLMMLYFWGQFDHPVIHRLSLPTQLLFWVGVLILLREAALRRVWIWRVLGSVAIATMVVWSLPTMARAAYAREYTPALAHAWRAEFLERLSDRNILMLDRDAIFWTTRQISVTPIKQARARRDGIAYHFRNHSFGAVYAYQTVKVDLETGAVTVVPEDDLGPGFELEVVAEHRLAIGRLGRISRVTAVHPGEIGDTTVSAPEVGAGPVAPGANPEGNPDFLREWLNNLP